MTLLILDATAWPQRALVNCCCYCIPNFNVFWHQLFWAVWNFSGGSLIDDCIDTAASTLNGNPNAALLCLQTAWHSNVKQEAVVEKRRKLEDKVMRPFGCIIFGCKWMTYWKHHLLCRAAWSHSGPSIASKRPWCLQIARMLLTNERRASMVIWTITRHAVSVVSKLVCMMPCFSCY